MSTVVDGAFEWDSEKAASNVVKHGVDFGEAMSALADAGALDFTDALHPGRIITVGYSTRERVLYVVTTETGDRTRIISARRAKPAERRLYEEG